MAEQFWQDLLLPQKTEDSLWELFHENSKIGRFGASHSDEEILTRMQELYESLPFQGYPEIPLPEARPSMLLSLDEAIRARHTERQLEPRSLTMKQLGSLLHYAYGISRSNEASGFPRPFRMVPSAGALYPLELFIYTAHVTDLKPGLYHYNPPRNSLRHIRLGNESGRIAEALIQPSFALGASLIVFITAVFERSIFKYGDRGYRFILLEAGHVAQNINLVTTAIGLSSVNIGGFRDREIDDYLELDGLTHSTIYMVALGGKRGSARTREN